MDGHDFGRVGEYALSSQAVVGQESVPTRAPYVFIFLDLLGDAEVMSAFRCSYYCRLVGLSVC